jgi:cell fate regulator YaaT (PSP1 superfamily)
LKYVVEFKGNRRGVYNASDNLAVEAGKYVIVQAERGEDMGLVRRTASASEYDPDQPLLNITRLATENDLDRLKFNNQKEIESKEECLKFIQKHQLKMKLVDVEYQFDCNKITFYFTAEKRVDFRELVKDLAATFRTRIELRQIGVRDEAKRIGGFGICGMEQCCSAFLKNFNTISTQMARSQGLALNPQKISGNCGRLLCCLKYEQDFYERILAKFPLEGSQFLFDEAPGTVEKCDIFKEQITVKFEDGEMRTISFGEYSRAMQRGQFKLTGASPITEEISETDNDDLKQIQEP